MTDGKELSYVSYMLVHEFATPPSKKSLLSAGYDLVASHTITISPGTRGLVGTGIKFQIPSHLYGQITSRSDLALMGIDVAGGVVDPYFDEEIQIILVNNSSIDSLVQPGDMIAQIIFSRILNQKKMYHQGGGPKNNNNQRGFGASGFSAEPSGFNNLYACNSGYNNQQRQQQQINPFLRMSASPIPMHGQNFVDRNFIQP